MRAPRQGGVYSGRSWVRAASGGVGWLRKLGRAAWQKRSRLMYKLTKNKGIRKLLFASRSFSLMHSSMDTSTSLTVFAWSSTVVEDSLVVHRTPLQRSSLAEAEELVSSED